MDDLLKIKNEYDAHYFLNKYSVADGTHAKEFERLWELFKDDGEAKVMLLWIQMSYDCYYKEEFEEQSLTNPFYYLETKIKEIEAREE